ncbi:YkgJ family cysteine cluster protein [Rufibacter roseolus]|uniref:YkgJ family cysteine cluster protein n=1 Tax=Rufibacter roseolus TaxID=2817375 RepID=UPI001B3010C7|nr:YkgJ family cysteine cluster protein [Rufibacter roseolus]
MSDSTNICLSCGLCCDGTVIGFVQVGCEELPLLRDVIDIENTNGDGFFLQPCKKYCDGCTIYSRRPKQCASFECGILKSIEKQELDFDSALDIINVVKQKKFTIERELAVQQFNLQSQSFYFKMGEVKKLFQKKSPDLALTPSQLNLIEEIKQLDNLLANEFDV